MKKTSLITCRIFIIHGYKSYPADCWFPWLKKELQKRGAVVYIPPMPNPSKPTMKNWISVIKKEVKKPDEKTYFVGHSLGAIAIIRYFETLKPNEKIGGAVIVAGRILGRKNFRGKSGTISSFFQKPINWQKIKRRSKHFIGIYSIDDPLVSTENGKLLQKKLGAKLILEKNKGHFSREDKIFKLLSVLRALRSSA